MDWAQLWSIVSQPDNIPIVALSLLVPFYAWLAWRQARATDQLIVQLEGNPELASKMRQIMEACPANTIANASFAMRERADRIGASLEIRNRAGGGTVIRVALPLAGHDQPAVAVHPGVGAGARDSGADVDAATGAGVGAA